MSREVEDRIAAAAGRQRGVATYAQLLEAGLSPSAMTRRLHSGRLRRLHRGVYLVSPFPLPLARERAAVLASNGVLSHESAAWLWGVRPEPAASTPVDVTRVGGGAQRPGIRVHRVDRLETDERTEKDGIPITTPVRTLMDLATLLGMRELEGAVARAEREGLLDGAALSRYVAGRRGRAGVRALRAVLAIPGEPALTRSVAEEEVLALIRKAGLPSPECNVRVGRYEVDFLWRAARIAVEVDGFRYHSSRPRFEGDRRKDAQLVAAGLTVFRVSWRQITREALATAVQLGQALARAANR